MHYITNYKSQLGEISLVSDKDNIVGLWLGKKKYMNDVISSDVVEDNDLPVLKKGRAWLDNYFSGKKPDISSLPLAPLASTEFRQVVWKILLEIPYGELTTYGDIAKEAAKRMGKERMSGQAVGGAVGHNPISIIIPCHRVVGSDGSLTGYGGGINIKIKLLELEGVNMDKLFVPIKSTAP